jgi:hypothetical protein
MEFEYRPKEWFEDWGRVLEASLTIPKESSAEHARRFFRSRYTNQAEVDWKCDRMLMAYRYLDQHIASFEKAGLTISGRKQATIGKSLSIALYRFFGHANDLQVQNQPSPEIIIAAAEEHQKD